MKVRLFIVFLLGLFFINIMGQRSTRRLIARPAIKKVRTSTKAAITDLTVVMTAPSSVCQGAQQSVSVSCAAAVLPYRLKYRLNTVSHDTVSNQSVIYMKINTNTAGVFVYQLDSVVDKNQNKAALSNKATVAVNPLPVSSFSFVGDSLCSGADVAFTPEVQSSTVYNYSWDFGDGKTSSEVTPDHRFLTYGDGWDRFQVGLTVTNKKTGCSTSASRWVYVKKASDPSLTSDAELIEYNGYTTFKKCENSAQQITFYNASTTLVRNTRYSIDWGDGSPLFDTLSWRSKTHTYGTGSWSLKYTVSNANGCAISTVYKIYVGSNPSVSLGNPGNTDVCSQTPVTFPISGTENNPPGTIYTLKFNDGSDALVFNDSVPASVTHTFLKSSCGVTSSNGTASFPNSFSATILASNPCGKSSVGVVPIYVSTAPSPDFKLSSKIICKSKPLTITDKDTVNTQASSTGCVNNKIVWKVTPSTGFTVTSGSLGNDFSATNYNVWSSGSEKLILSFDTPGQYIISMKGANKCGMGERSDTICVTNPSKPAFQVDNNSGCIPLTVHTTNLTDETTLCTDSMSYSWKVVSYQSAYCGNAQSFSIQTAKGWENNSSSTLKNPSITFNNAGIYGVQMSATNACDPVSSTIQYIHVKSPVRVSVGSIGKLCQSVGTTTISPVATVNLCSSSTASYEWLFPDGTPSVSSQAVPGTVSYSGSGIKKIYLRVTGDCGTQADSTSFTINPLPAMNNVSDQTKCAGQMSDTVVFEGVNANQYSWTNSNSSTGIPAAGIGTIKPYLLTNTSGTVQTSVITVTPKNTVTGCIGVTKTFRITLYPKLKAEISGADTVCVNSGSPVVKMKGANGSPPYTFNYQVDGGAVQSITTPGNADSVLFSVPTDKVHQFSYALLSVSDASLNSCQATINKQVLIGITPYPEIVRQYTDTICNSESLSINPTLDVTNVVPAGTSYTWPVPEIYPAGAIKAVAAQSKATSVINLPALINTTDSMATALFTITPTSGGCMGNSFTVRVFVQPSAKVKFSDSGQNVCSGAPTHPVILTSPTQGATLKWTLKVPAGITNIKNLSGLDTIPSETPVNASTTAQTLIYEAVATSASASGCSGLVYQYPVIVYPVSSLTKVSDQSVCNQVASQPVVLASPVAGTSFRWTNSCPSINLPASGVGNIPSFIPYNSGTSDSIALITVYPTANGCEGVSSTFKIVVHPTATVLQPADQELCNGYMTSAVSLSGNVTGALYKWTVDKSGIGLGAVSGTGDIPAFKAQNNGSAVVVANFVITPVVGGCDGSYKSFHITINPSPYISSQPLSQSLCQGDAAAQLTVGYKNSAVVPEYQWYVNTVPDSIGGRSIAGATAPGYQPPTDSLGTKYYYCKLAFSSGGCTSLVSSVAQVVVHAYPQIQSYSLSIGSGQQVTIQASGQATDVVPAGTVYRWSAPVISPAGAVSGASAQAVATTGVSQTLVNNTTSAATVDYTVIPVSASCQGNAFHIKVLVYPPLIISSNVSQVGCYTGKNGAISTVVSGGNPPYSYYWTGSNGYYAFMQPSIELLSPGTYSLTVTDGNGVTAVKTFEVTEPAELRVKSSKVSQIFCYGASDGSIAVTPYGGTMPYTYHWTRNGVAFKDSTSNLTNLSPGVYQLTLSDKNGCGPVTTSYTITQPTEMVVTKVSQTNLICYGDNNGTLSVSVTGGKPAYSYLWNGPNAFQSSLQNLSGLYAGVYKLTVTDSVGCTKSLTASITQPDSIRIGVVQTPVTCWGANDATISVSFSGGTAPYTYEWSNYAKSTSLKDLAPGLYTITVTDAAGCKKQKTIVVSEAAFSINPKVTAVSCNGAADGAIVLNIKGGVKPISVKWTDNSSAGDARYRLSPGSYTVTLTDAASCPITKTFIITQPLPLSVSSTVTNAFDCNNVNSGAIKVVVSGGTQPYSYKWSNGATTAAVSSIPAGTYVLTVTDANGCSVQKQYEILRQEALSLTVETQAGYSCEKKSMTQRCIAQVKGGVPPYKYTWSSGTLVGTVGDTMVTTVSGPVVVVVTDAMGCSTNCTFNVVVGTVGIESTLSDCNTRSYIFNAQIPVGLVSNYRFLWSFGDGSADAGSQDVTHVFPAAGIYKVTLTLTGYNCTSVFEKTIDVGAAPSLQLDKLPVFCTGESLVLHVSGAYSYKWNNGSTADSIVITKPGSYSVNGYSKQGCGAYLSFDAKNFDSYNYSISSNKNQVSLANPSIDLWSESITFSDYFWDFGDGSNQTGVNTSHKYDINRDGYYDVKLKVTNPHGCIEYANKRIWITSDGMNNTFTPNGDGIDDVFMKGWHIKVYNRDGVMMYDGSDGWDGTYKGNKVKNDTYFFVVYYQVETSLKTRTGFVTVVR